MPRTPPGHTDGKKARPSRAGQEQPMQEPTHRRRKPAPADAQRDMTQETFDRQSEVVLATECTGLAPAGQLDEEQARMLAELGGDFHFSTPR